jgi:hypothetical protein
MITVSKYPGTNAMAVLHDHVSYSLNFNLVTNFWKSFPLQRDAGAPAQDQIRKAAQDAKRR